MPRDAPIAQVNADEFVAREHCDNCDRVIWTTANYCKYCGLPLDEPTEGESTTEKGDRHENEAKWILKRWYGSGVEKVDAYGVHDPFHFVDLIAIQPGEPVTFVQVKTNGFSEADKQKYRTHTRHLPPIHANFEVWIRHDRQGWVLYEFDGESFHQFHEIDTCDTSEAGEQYRAFRRDGPDVETVPDREDRLTKSLDTLFPEPTTEQLVCPDCGHEHRVAWKRTSDVLAHVEDGCEECGGTLSSDDVERVSDGLCRVCGEQVVDGRWAYCSERCRELASQLQAHFLWDAVRDRIIRRDDRTCQACGEQHPPRRLEVDHVQPLSKGGHPFDDGNLQTLCEGCHAEKTAEQNRSAEAAEPAPDVTLEAFTLTDGGDEGGE